MLQFTDQEKETIGQKMMEQFEAGNFDKLSRFAASVDLLPADMTNIKAVKWKEQPQLIGAPKWIKMARIVGYDKRESIQLKTARTKTFKYVVSQLETAQQNSLSKMLVDDAGIGKTVAAQWYAENNKYAFYIDCSDNPNKARFIRALSQSLGIGRNGKLNDLLDDSIYMLRQLVNPILIFDEYGDLEDTTVLIQKRLYNSLKGICAFYKIGADGMKKKITRGIENEKLGYVEVFSRDGRSYNKVTPQLMDERVSFYREQAHDIAIENGLTKSEANEISTMLTKGGQLNDMRFVENAVKGFLKQKQAHHEN